MNLMHQQTKLEHDSLFDGISESASRDHVDQGAQQDGLRHSELSAVVLWSI